MTKLVKPTETIMEAEDELAWLPEPEELEYLMTLEIEDSFLETLLREDGDIPLDQEMEDEQAPQAEEPNGEVDLQENSEGETAGNNEENPAINGTSEHSLSPTMPEPSEADPDV